MNGIIINDELHELASMRIAPPCDNCSLLELCTNNEDVALCALIAGRLKSNEQFINRGNVKEFIEKLNS